MSRHLSGNNEDRSELLKIVILCGGKGTRLQGEGEYKPKPMMEIGQRPMLWHIMQTYAHFGYSDFVLALGFKASVIKEYFLNHRYVHNDLTVHLAKGDVTVHPKDRQYDWSVTMVDTGENTLKGGRIARVKEYLDGERFMVTYGDGVANLDIDKLLEFHEETGAVGTFTGVRMPSRFGSMEKDSLGRSIRWEEKPILENYVNGGYFVFEPEFLEYLSEDKDCELEKNPLEQLAADGQLALYQHDGFWQCMDTYRDFVDLNRMWDAGDRPWLRM